MVLLKTNGAVLTSTHKICFGVEKKHIVASPYIPQFHLIKVGFKMVYNTWYIIGNKVVYNTYFPDDMIIYFFSGQMF